MENSIIKDWMTVVFWLIMATPLIICVVIVGSVCFVLDWIYIIINRIWKTKKELKIEHG